MNGYKLRSWNVVGLRQEEHAAMNASIESFEKGEEEGAARALLSPAVRERWEAFLTHADAADVVFARDGSFASWVGDDVSPVALVRVAAACHRLLQREVPPEELMAVLAHLEAVLCTHLASGEKVVGNAVLGDVSELKQFKKLGDAVRALADERQRSVCMFLFGFEGLNVRNILAHGFCFDVPPLLSALVLVVARSVISSLPPVEIEYAPLFQIAPVRESVLPVKQQLKGVLRRARELISQQQHRGALLLMFANLEQELRAMYCAENECEAQLLLATDKRLFLTLDILLASCVKRPGRLASSPLEENDEEEKVELRGQRNRIFDHADKQWALEIMETFVWSPVRLRDTLFHGRCDPRQQLAGECAKVMQLCVAMGCETGFAAGCRHHPMRQLAGQLNLKPAEWIVLPSEALIRHWTIWTKITAQTNEIASLVPDVSLKLAERAASRANKKKAFALFEQHRGLFEDFATVVREAAIANLFVESGEHDSLSLSLFQTSGAVLGSLKRNESLIALHYLAAFFSEPDRLGPSLLSKAQLASVAGKGIE